MAEGDKQALLLAMANQAWRTLAEHHVDIQRIASSGSVTLPGDMSLIYKVFNTAAGELILRAYDATPEDRDG